MSSENKRRQPRGNYGALCQPQPRFDVTNVRPGHSDKRRATSTGWATARCDRELFEGCSSRFKRFELSHDLMANVSVIIPTHSRPDLLPRAVKSAREASTDVEIIVVDDASTDATAEVCRALADIRYVRLERNQAVAGARNIGLVASSSEYVCFLDDDDVRLPLSLDQQTRILDQTPEAMMVYAQAIPEYADGTRGRPFPSEFPQGDIFWELLIRNFIPSGSVVFRRSCISQIGMLDDTIPGIDDWDLWIRVAEIFPAAVMETPALIWRQSTVNSGQGSSATLDLIECGRK